MNFMHYMVDNNAARQRTTHPEARESGIFWSIEGFPYRRGKARPVS